MADALPEVVSRLLASPASPDDEPWADFVRQYSRLLLHVARSLGGDHDAAMDRYAYLLEHLRQDNCRRLRLYAADGRSEFSTWLVVVAQRLCLDHHRWRYGRPRAVLHDAPAQDEERRARRRLVDLVSVEVDLDRLRGNDSRGPDEEMDETDRYRALEAALGALPPSDRMLVRLHYEDGLPMSEVARALGCASRFQAYRRLRAVLAALRRVLQQDRVR
jgi:RNA polymerase sigma factor (sigma-70 family)